MWLFLTGCVFTAFETPNAEEDAGQVCPYSLALSDEPPSYHVWCEGVGMTTELQAGDILQNARSNANPWYYTGAGRYAIPHGTVFESWYGNNACACANVKLVPDDVAVSIQLRGVVTIRPGSFLVKTAADPAMFAIERPCTLRPVGPDNAESIYGADWESEVRIVPEAFFAHYTIGSALEDPSDYSLATQLSTTINQVVSECRH